MMTFQMIFCYLWRWKRCYGISSLLGAAHVEPVGCYCCCFFCRNREVRHIKVTKQGPWSSKSYLRQLLFAPQRRSASKTAQTISLLISPFDLGIPAPLALSILPKLKTTLESFPRTKDYFCSVVLGTSWENQKAVFIWQKGQWRNSTENLHLSLPVNRALPMFLLPGVSIAMQNMENSTHGSVSYVLSREGRKRFPVFTDFRVLWQEKEVLWQAKGILCFRLADT